MKDFKDIVITPEMLANAYETGFADAASGEDWKKDPAEIRRVTFGRYQVESSRTLPKEGADPAHRRHQRMVSLLGLAGEVGETIDMLKKVEGHGHELDRDKLTREIGDILWYCAAICTYYGINFDEAAVCNIEKLRLRYPDGFNERSSRERSV